MAEQDIAERSLRELRSRYKAAVVARALGLTPQAVSAWRRFPAERLLEIEAATGIPREQLRPDLYRPGAG
jgi:DNA-binding transcriptional regulator YdaS (Cro superfamily)